MTNQKQEALCFLDRAEMIFCYSRKPGLGNQPAENTSNNVIQTCFRSQEEDSYPRHSLLGNSENNKCLCCARSHQFTIKPRSQSIIWPQTQSPLLQFQTNLKILEQRLVNSYGKSLFSFNILWLFVQVDYTWFSLRTGWRHFGLS